MTGFGVDVHCVSEVEATTATSATGFRDESCDDGLCCDRICLGSGKRSTEVSQRSLLFLC